MKKTEQNKIFKKSEGDQWYNRNINSFNLSNYEASIHLKFLKNLQLNSKNILEIGCSSGYKLDYLSTFYNAKGYGIDPSSKAITEGNILFPNLELKVATAENIPFNDDKMDLIIFGFSLYLCDRKDLFKIAFEADRCLKNNGIILIEDFLPPFPYKNKYAHLEGIFTYKMDYSKIFTWNSDYSNIGSIVYSHEGFSNRDLPNEKVATIAIKKQIEYGYPNNPF